jgi:PAS domain S-box-containing protein
MRDDPKSRKQLMEDLKSLRQEVSRLKKAEFTSEAELQMTPRKSRERLLTLQKVAGIGLLEWDLKTNRIVLSDEVRRLYGLVAQDELPTPDFVNRVVHPDDYDYVQKELEQALSGTRKYNIDHRILRPDGVIVWVNAQAELIYDENGDPAILMGTVWDITDRKRAEAALRESEERFRILSEATFEGVAISHHGRLVDVTEQLAHMLGYEKTEMIGKEIVTFVAPSSREIVAGHVRAGTQEPYEHKLRRRDGSELFVESRARTLNHAGGLLRVTVIRDITERKRAEEGFKQSSEWQQAIFEGSRDATFISDQNLRFVAVNKAACDLTGYSREQLLKMRIPDLHDHPDLNTSTRFYQRILDGEEIRTEAAILRNDGTKAEAEFSNRCVSIAGMTYMHTSARDITERKQGEEALRASEALQRALLTNLPAGVVIVDPVTRVIEMVNDHAAVLFGASVDHLVGQRCQSFLCPAENGSCPVCDLGQSVDNSDSVMLRADGSRLATLKTVKRILLNGQEKLLECFVDVSARKSAEEALHESEEKFRLTFSASPDAVSISRLNDGLYVDITEGFTRLTGFVQEDVIGKTSLDLKIWHDIADRQKLVQGLREHGLYENLEAVLRRKDGSLTTTLISARIFPLKGVEHIIAIIRDITERKRLEEQLLQAQKLEAVGQLAGSVAHDFNNILAAMMMRLSLLQQDSSIAPVTKEALIELETDAKRAADLTRQLLQFGRRQVMQIKALDLNDLLGNLLKMLRRLLGEQINLVFEGTATTLWIQADQGMIE